MWCDPNATQEEGGCCVIQKGNIVKVYIRFHRLLSVKCERDRVASHELGTNRAGSSGWVGRIRCHWFGCAVDGDTRDDQSDLQRGEDTVLVDEK